MMKKTFTKLFVAFLALLLAPNWAWGLNSPEYTYIATFRLADDGTATQVNTNSPTESDIWVYVKELEGEGDNVAIVKVVLPGVKLHLYSMNLVIPTTVSYKRNQNEEETNFTVTQINTSSFSNDWEPDNYYYRGWLANVTIPAGITLQAGAFKNLTRLKSVTFAEGCNKADYADNVFQNITPCNDSEVINAVELNHPASWGNVDTDWAGGYWLPELADNEFIAASDCRPNLGNIYNTPIRYLYRIIGETSNVELVKALDKPDSRHVTNFEFERPTNMQIYLPSTVENGETTYTVTKICEGAFKDINWVYIIKLPSGLTEIEDLAFENLDNLYYVSFEDVEATQSTFDWTEDDVKFRNIKYSATQMTNLKKPSSWTSTVYDDWGGGTVSIWSISNTTHVTRYGVFVNGIQITSKNKDDVLGDSSNSVTYTETSTYEGWYAKLTLSGTNLELDNIKNVYTNAHIAEESYYRNKLQIYIGKGNNVTLSSSTVTPLICGYNTEIKGGGNLTIASSAAGKATITVADGMSLNFNDINAVVNNTGNTACISTGTGSTVSLYGNIEMTTNGTAVAPELTTTSVVNSNIIAGGLDESSVRILENMKMGESFTRDIEFNDEKVLRLTFCVTDADEKTVSWCMSKETPNPNNVTNVDLVVPTTVIGPDGVEYTVTSIATMALAAELHEIDETTFDYTPVSYVRSLVIPETIEEIKNNALMMVSNLQSVEFKMPYTDLNEINAEAFYCITSGGSDKIDTSIFELAEDAPAVTLIFPEGSPAVGPTWAGGNWTGDFIDENAVMPGDTFVYEDCPIAAEDEGDVAGTVNLHFVITKAPAGNSHGEVMLYQDGISGSYAEGFDSYYMDGSCAVTDPKVGNENSEDVKGALVIPAEVTYNEKTYDVTTIGGSAFFDVDDSDGNYVPLPCPYVNSITFPTSIENVYTAFWANELTSVTFLGDRVPDSSGNIDYYAFDGVTATLTVPASWGLVADDWNYGTWTSINYVKEVELDENGNEVETTPVNFAVADADNLEMTVASSEELTEEGTVVIPATVTLGTDDFTVTAIGDGAFEGQTNLTGVTLPQTLISIGAKAFKDCGAVSEVTFLGAVPTISDDAFSGTTVTKANYPAAAESTDIDTKLAAVKATTTTTSPCVFTSTEWTTLYSGVDFTLPNDVEAYIVTNVDFTTGKLTVAPTGGKVKANTPLLLRKQPTGDDMYPITSFADVDISGAGEPCNEFKGSTEPVAITNTENTQYYILVNGQFVKATDGTLPAYKCYILSEALSGAPALNIEIQDGETTGISDVRSKKDDVRGEWYDLSGRKLQGKPTQKGVYIINGKKVNVK